MSTLKIIKEIKRIYQFITRICHKKFICQSLHQIFCSCTGRCYVKVILWEDLPPSTNSYNLNHSVQHRSRCAWAHLISFCKINEDAYLALCWIVANECNWRLGHQAHLLLWYSKWLKGLEKMANHCPRSDRSFHDQLKFIPPTTAAHFLPQIGHRGSQRIIYPPLTNTHRHTSRKVTHVIPRGCDTSLSLSFMCQSLPGWKQLGNYQIFSTLFVGSCILKHFDFFTIHQEETNCKIWIKPFQHASHQSPSFCSKSIVSKVG